MKPPSFNAFRSVIGSRPVALDVPLGRMPAPGQASNLSRTARALAGLSRLVHAVRLSPAKPGQAVPAAAIVSALLTESTPAQLPENIPDNWAKWAENAPFSERQSRYEACQRLSVCMQTDSNTFLDLHGLPISELPDLATLPTMKVPEPMVESVRASGRNPWAGIPRVKVIYPEKISGIDGRLTTEERWFVQRFLERFDKQLAPSERGARPAQLMQRLAVVLDRGGKVNPQFTQQLATALFQTMRQDLYKPGYKSSNKGHSANKALNDAEKAFYKARRRQAIINADRDPGNNVGQHALAVVSHNCLDLAAAGYNLLRLAGVRHAAIVGFNQEDHAVLVIGDSPSRFKTNFHHLSKSAFVCDPWANIVAPVEQYPETYMNKMEQWKDKGKRVFDSRVMAWKSAFRPDIADQLRSGFRTGKP